MISGNAATICTIASGKAFVKEVNNFTPESAIKTKNDSSVIASPIRGTISVIAAKIDGSTSDMAVTI